MARIFRKMLPFLIDVFSSTNAFSTLPCKNQSWNDHLIKTANAKLCNRIVIMATNTPTNISCFFVYNSKTNPFKCPYRNHYHHSN
jgi:hypothetical protein